jgi:hypothetical protein
MSRLVVAVFAAHFVMTPAAAQPSKAEDGVAARIERALPHKLMRPKCA